MEMGYKDMVYLHIRGSRAYELSLGSLAAIEQQDLVKVFQSYRGMSSCRGWDGCRGSKEDDFEIHIALKRVEIYFKSFGIST